jgi:hypothetical protein
MMQLYLHPPCAFMAQFLINIYIYIDIYTLTLGTQRTTRRHIPEDDTLHSNTKMSSSLRDLRFFLPVLG